MSTKTENTSKSIEDRFAFLVLSLAILAVSTAAIFIRFAQKTMPSLPIAAYRLVFASLMLCPFTVKKAFKELRGLKKHSVGLMLLSGFLLALHFASWIISLEFTNVISSVVLVTTTPIWVTALSPLILNEKIPKRFFFGLGLAFVGILMISNGSSISMSSIRNGGLLDSNIEILKGNLLAIIGAICAAGYVILGRKLRITLSTGSYTLCVYAIAGLLLIGYLLITNHTLLEIEIIDLKWLILLALVPQTIGHSLINWSLGIFPAYLVAISLLGEPIGSTIMAIIFLNEIPAVFELISAGIIMAGIFIAVSEPKMNQ